MPNKVSARKRVRQNERRRIRNRSTRSAMRTAVKKVEAAVVAKDVKTAAEALSAAQSKLGKAAKNNIIKKNTAARKQSRLAKAINRATAAAKA